MISGDLDNTENGRFHELRKKVGEIEKLLKAMIKSLENKHLAP